MKEKKSKIKHLKNSEIDYLKWDTCISKSINSQVFAYSWYLDSVSEGWEALVEGDYEKVMPLPYSKKLKYSILKNPNFAPQLGIYSKTTIDEKDTNNFLNSIPDKFKVINFSLNKYVKIPQETNTEQISFQTLDLISPYTKTIEKYSWQALQKLKYAKDNKYTVKAGINPHVAINFMENENMFENSNDYLSLKKLMSKSLQKRLSVVFGCYNYTNSLIAVGFFAFSNFNVNLIFLKSKNETAAMATVNHFIRINSGKDLSFNIENQNIDYYEQIISGITSSEFFSSKIYINRMPKIFKFFSQKGK